MGHHLVETGGHYFRLVEPSLLELMIRPTSQIDVLEFERPRQRVEFGVLNVAAATLISNLRFKLSATLVLLCCPMPALEYRRCTQALCVFKTVYFTPLMVEPMQRGFYI